MKFEDEIVEYVWEKAQKVENVNPMLWRKDLAGAWIKRYAYGHHDDYGWEIGLKTPRSEWGEFGRENLIPLHWRNHESKGESFPEFETSVTSKGYINVEEEQFWSYASENQQKPMSLWQRIMAKLKNQWRWLRFCFCVIDEPV